MSDKIVSYQLSHHFSIMDRAVLLLYFKASGFNETLIELIFDPILPPEKLLYEMWQ